MWSQVSWRCALSLMPRMCAQRPSEVCTFPSASDLGSRRLELLLQENSPNCPQVSFSENPPAQSCSSIQGRACPLTQPTSPARPGTVWVTAPHGPTLNSVQLAPTVLGGLPLCPYSSPCDFKQPGLSLCCSSLVWQGRGPLTQLSLRSPVAGWAGAGLGLQSPCSLCWSQGPFCPEAIALPSFFFFF